MADPLDHGQADRREPQPPRRRSSPTLGPRTDISVPISFGLPLMVVGLFLVINAVRIDSTLFWILGLAGLGLGLILFASGKRL